MVEINATLESIQRKLSKIEAARTLRTEEAFDLTDEIAEAVGEAILECEKAEKFKEVEKLARKAEEAYLLAADRVRSKVARDKIVFASTYWSLKADYARLDAEVPRRPAPYQPKYVPAKEQEGAKDSAFIHTEMERGEKERAMVPDMSFLAETVEARSHSAETAKAKELMPESLKERKPTKDKRRREFAKAQSGIEGKEIPSHPTKKKERRDRYVRKEVRRK